MSNSTEGMSWPDTLRWLAEHDGDYVEVKCDKAWHKWNQIYVSRDCIYRLAQRKPRVGGKVWYNGGTMYINWIERIPGKTVVLERMPTLDDVNKYSGWLNAITHLRVDIDET